jgi:predicted TIM-barrel fold metal-dependent hydrolase
MSVQSPVTKTQLPKIISVDDHVIEPPNVWTSRLPRNLRSVGPRVERLAVDSRLEDGKLRTVRSSEGRVSDCWVYEDKLIQLHRGIAAVGLENSQVTTDQMDYSEMRPGCYDPKARLLDMDVNWIEASLCFPTIPRFCGQTFTEANDKDLALLCVRAYNDWMIDEWCGDSDGRLIPLCIAPLWDVGAAIEEVTRNASRGVRAVAFSEIPSYLGLPSINSGYWDPFLQTCEETRTTVCMHIGSSSRYFSTSADAHPAAISAADFTTSMLSLLDFLFSGILVKHPGLQLSYSEGQIGWIPYVLERADGIWNRQSAWSEVGNLPMPPSFYFRQSVFGCFFNDRHGLMSLEEIGEDNVTFETDYPHTDSTWPDTKRIAESMVEGLDDSVIMKVMRGNAIRMLDLDFE